MATAKATMEIYTWTCPGCGLKLGSINPGYTKADHNQRTAEHVATCEKIQASDRVFSAAGKAYLRRSRIVSLTIPHGLHDWAKELAARTDETFSGLVQDLLEELRRGCE